MSAAPTSPRRFRRCGWAILPLLLIGCGPSTSAPANSAEPAAQARSGRPFAVQEVGRFDEPWAIAFLPRSTEALVTEKAGRLKLWRAGKATLDVAGVPAVSYAGQGGLADVVLGPHFVDDGMVYLSWAEAGAKGTRGGAVGRGRLNLSDPEHPRIDGLTVIWRQVPKVSGAGQYALRIAFSPDGRYMFIASGERQKETPAQDMTTNLGKILRLFPDGSVPPDNPFAGRPSPTDQIWTLGHRNPLGIAFDDHGNLWESEMGPRGGDELNLIDRKSNYGWPNVSFGDNYDGSPIPKPRPGDGYTLPKLYWVPSISPASLIFYSGELFPEWKDSLFMGALSGEALVRIQLNDQRAAKAEQWPMGARIRDVAQDGAGVLYVLEDGPDARLLKLTRAAGGQP